VAIRTNVLPVVDETTRIVDLIAPGDFNPTFLRGSKIQDFNKETFMNRFFKLSAHLVIWAVFYLVFLSVVDSFLETAGMGNFLNPGVISQLALILLISLVIPFYIFFFLAQPGFKKRTSFLLTMVGCSLLLLLPIGYISLDGEPLSVAVYLKTLVLVIFFAMLGYLFRGFLHGLRLKREKDSLHRQLLETELDFLKGQINPHFLFNTINNIDALITTRPAEASRSLIAMAEIMRYMIYDTRENIVLLRKELYYLESLLSLYSLRFKKEGLVRLNVNGDPSDYRIPPMLLIPIAENAFKHHSKKHSLEGILFDVYIEDDRLRISSSNGYEPAIQNAGVSGLGIQTLKRRLDLLFPNNYTLNIHPVGYVFNITLIIPLVDTCYTAHKDETAIAAL
jgi:two-component system, LytTR family, sensor kinase